MHAQRATAAALVVLSAAVIVAVIARPSHHPAAHSAAATARLARVHGRPPPAAPISIRGSAARHTAVPILMYHVIGTPAAGTAYQRLWVAAHDFAVQMRALQRAGYHAVTLRQAFDAWFDRGGFPRRPIVISFDDGYRGQYANAFPVLRQLGWRGVLNLELRNIGRGGITNREVQALVAAGWEVDSHTIDHPDLTQVSAAQLRREVSGSRRALQRHFGVPVDFFCYPAGRYDRRVIASVEAVGYAGATTTRPGYATRSTPFTLPRLEVRGGESAAALLARLAAAPR